MTRASSFDAALRPTLSSRHDPAGELSRSNEEQLLELLNSVAVETQRAIGGGGERYRKRHSSRGKLLARERIELLVDPGSAFLELSPLAAWGSEFHVGGSIVTGIGVVAGVECVVIAHDPTVRGGTMNPFTLKKNLRALQIALENRLPVIDLVESGGADLTTQADLFIPAGQIFRDHTRLSALGVPTIALVFGNATAGGAYVPGMCDYAVMVDRAAKVFLGGPPLVKMATGEIADDEALGGALMHATTSGLGDFFAHDEHECIRIGREIMADVAASRRSHLPPLEVEDPLYDPSELLGLAPVDLKIPLDPKEIIARIVDGSRFHEYKARYGTSMTTGWAAIHGWPVGIIANARGVIFNDEAKKTTEFIMLANQSGIPLIFLHNTTGFMVGTTYEQAGIIKDGAKMINAVANSRVPHLSVIIGASYGAGNYGMCGRAYDPRFLFVWPNAKIAVMGPQQLAGVMSIVARESALSQGRPFDEIADDEQRRRVEEQIEHESEALFMTGKIYDDGIIDPRDTRTVLGITLSAVQGRPLEEEGRFGVFRM
jgi:acetyl-CoA carboxylase carboxyltransferase component